MYFLKFVLDVKYVDMKENLPTKTTCGLDSEIYYVDMQNTRVESTYVDMNSVEVTETSGGEANVGQTTNPAVISNSSKMNSEPGSQTSQTNTLGSSSVESGNVKDDVTTTQTNSNQAEGTKENKSSQRKTPIKGIAAVVVLDDDYDNLPSSDDECYVKQQQQQQQQQQKEPSPKDDKPKQQPTESPTTKDSHPINSAERNNNDNVSSLCKDPDDVVVGDDYDNLSSCDEDDDDDDNYVSTDQMIFDWLIF